MLAAYDNGLTAVLLSNCIREIEALMAIPSSYLALFRHGFGKKTKPKWPKYKKYERHCCN